MNTVTLLILPLTAIILSALYWSSNRSNDEERQLVSIDLTATPIKILSLGGSVTWGVGLGDNKDLTYSSLLKRLNFVQRSDNLAIRASGAVWPSTCIQSMILESGQPDDYNVILLEFSINGLMGLQLLSQRLRHRYPSSVIIYIDLYSNRTPGYSNCIGERCRLTPTKLQGLEELLGRVKGHLISMPRPKNPKEYTNDVSILQLFAEDHHHLSAKGHEWIADRVAEVLQKHAKSIDLTSAEQGSWLEGDLCLSWFKSGVFANKITAQGGEMWEFAQYKFAYEINRTATFQIDASSLQGNAPFILVYMTYQDSYPSAHATLDGSIKALIPFRNKRWNDVHVTTIHYQSMVEPGQHTLVLENLEKDKAWPFRLVGITMCAACLTFDPSFLDRKCNQRACVETIEMPELIPRGKPKHGL